MGSGSCGSQPVDSARPTQTSRYVRRTMDPCLPGRVLGEVYATIQGLSAVREWPADPVDGERGAFVILAAERHGSTICACDRLSDRRATGSSQPRDGDRMTTHQRGRLGRACGAGSVLCVLAVVGWHDASASEPAQIPAGMGEDAFHIDRTEVTVTAFEAFVEAGGYRERELWTPEGWVWARGHEGGAGAELRSSERPSDHPVVAVTWYEADAYCRWSGGQLPSDDQWTRAVCPTGGDYPWGDGPRSGVVWFDVGKYGHVTAVTTRPAEEQDPSLASAHGLVHGAGNVWEWTSTPFDEGRRWHTLRGGSFMNMPSYSTCEHREPARPDEPRLTAGFRCAYP